MTPAAPQRSGTVPLPLREQADVRDRWLTQRLLDLLPALMDRAGIDLWIVVGREGNEDPVLATLLPATWLSARRRTVLVLHRSDDGVTPVAVSRYPVGQFLPAWTPEDGDAQPPARDPLDTWGEVRRIVEQAAPRRIGIDVSAEVALADGLSCTDHRLLVEALGPHADRLVPAEDLVVGWLETRLPEEVAALHALTAAVDRVVREAWCPPVLAVGRTTAADLAWWMRQRLADLGVPSWFHPVVDVQRAGHRQAGGEGVLRPAVPYDAVVEHGDLLHCDVGGTTLGLAADVQRTGYVLRPGERAAPEGLRAAVRTGRRAQDLTAAQLAVGRTGNEVLVAARAATAAEGIDAVVYAHPIGVHGHGAGPQIGRWDDQSGVPGAGDRVLHPDTAYALELAVRVPVPEWGGQPVRIGVEDGVVLTEAGVEWLGGRRGELLLVPPG